MKTAFKYIIPSLVIISFLILAITEKADFDSGDYLNFGLTLLTYFYVVFTWEMLERMKTESYLERRPYLVADFKSPKSNLHFELENIGKTHKIMKNIKLLDCTLRDGGYYNRWDFSENLIVDYLDCMKNCSVDYIELGFRTLKNVGFKGPCAYTKDEFINSVVKFSEPKIDEKD